MTELDILLLMRDLAAYHNKVSGLDGTVGAVLD
jgi:hypothetical protein